MNKKLYVGNLAYSVTERDLTEMVQAFGQPDSVSLIMDRDTGRSKGFAFVEMGNPEQAQAVIQALNGKEIDGRALSVNEARPREEGSGGGYGGNRRNEGGYGGGGGGYRGNGGRQRY